jgi:hypothetical protein
VRRQDLDGPEWHPASDLDSSRHRDENCLDEWLSRFEGAPEIPLYGFRQWLDVGFTEPSRRWAEQGLLNSLDLACRARSF